MRSIRICVLGAGAVGKSSMTVRFVHGSFYENYDPTIEDSFTKITNIEQGKPCRLQITDTAGVEQMITLRESVIRESHAFLLVFSLDSTGSYHDLMAIVEDIKRIKDVDSIKRVPIVVCGNKVDLGFERVFPAPFKPSSQLSGIKYIETSAKAEIGVEEAFIVLSRLYVDKRQRHKERRKQRQSHTHKSRCILM